MVSGMTCEAEGSQHLHCLNNYIWAEKQRRPNCSEVGTDDLSKLLLYDGCKNMFACPICAENAAESFKCLIWGEVRML